MYPISQIDSIVFYSTGPSGPTIADIDGNVYDVIAIGAQEWIGQNLKVTHFSDGSSIENITNSTSWVDTDTAAYCWYNNDISYKNSYGALYNWDAVDNGMLCPEGWHVPSDGDWDVLINFIGGENVAGGKLKEVGTTHWNSPNTGATNDYNYTALPGGMRDQSGNFNLIQDQAYFWSSTEAYPSSAWYRYLLKSSAKASRHHQGKMQGFSVRCIKD
jgi:uncharacterized protein (TIGR02145 family)